MCITLDSQPGQREKRPSALPSGVFLLSAFTSQAFWDAFEQILPETSETLAPEEDPLDQALLRLLGLGKEKHWLVVGCWPTIPPTSTPTLPAPPRETNRHSAAIKSRAATICAKWV